MIETLTQTLTEMSLAGRMLVLMAIMFTCSLAAGLLLRWSDRRSIRRAQTSRD